MIRLTAELISNLHIFEYRLAENLQYCFPAEMYLKKLSNEPVLIFVIIQSVEFQ